MFRTQYDSPWIFYRPENLKKIQVHYCGGKIFHFFKKRFTDRNTTFLTELKKTTFFP